MKKVKHARDYIHNRDADVIKHGSGKAISDTHWEKDISASSFPQNHDIYPENAFLPMPGSKRARPHVKVNECDY